MKFMKSLLLLPLLALAAPAFAQDGKMAIGVQGGPVYSDYSATNLPAGRALENNDGYLGGLFFEFGLSSVTLRPELNYVVKGYTIGGLAEVKHKYLEIPLLLKVNPFADFVVSPFLVVGPSWSTHLSSDVKFLGTTTTFNDSAQDWDLAGVAGLGVEFNVAENVALSVQGRYNFGLRDIDDSSQEIKSRGIYGLAGVALLF